MLRNSSGRNARNNTSSGGLARPVRWSARRGGWIVFNGAIFSLLGAAIALFDTYGRNSGMLDVANARVTSSGRLTGVKKVNAGTGQGTLQGRVRVVDGDSLVLNGNRIRLIGLDAPEASQRCRFQGAKYSCGVRSTAYLSKLIGWRQVSCRSNKRDRYNRLLATCVAGGTDLNAEMVRAGWAISFYGGYQREEGEARVARRGLWGGEFERPQDYRRRKRR